MGISLPHRDRAVPQTCPRTIWRDIPPSFAGILRPRIAAIAARMVEAIQREVPAYQLPLHTALGRDLVEATTRALRQFADLVTGDLDSVEDEAGFFRELGRAEYRNGRVLDHLQAAYRVGARVACRAYTTAGREAGLPAGDLVVLGEAVLVHIDALAKESAGGHAAERARDERDRDSAERVERARGLLVERLVDRRGPCATPALAVAARWPLPARVACAVVPSTADVPGPAVLTTSQGGDLVFVGAPADLLDAVRDPQAVIGPPTPPERAWLSLACARAAGRLARRPGGAGPVLAQDHLADLLLTVAPALGDLFASEVLTELDGLDPVRRQRAEETLAALLASWGRTAPEVAARLGIHPQTARTRLRQLDDVLGDKLKDPAFRAHAQISLRIRALAAESATDGTGGSSTVP